MEEALATVTSIAPFVSPTDGAATPVVDEYDQVLKTLTGRRKAAVLVLQLPPQQSARVLAHMRDTELEEISAEIARLTEVTPAMSGAVLREFGIAAAGSPTLHGGLDQTRDLLVAAVGETRANEILGRLSVNVMDLPFKFLHHADARQLLSFIADEHPQIIALVLAHIPAPLASQVLGGLPHEVQAEVAHRIAIMDRTSPELIRQVEASLERRMATLLVSSDLSSVGGVEPLVEIINRADRGTEKQILEGLEARDPELAEAIRSRMFMFEDLVHLDDRAVQLVLRQVETNNLAIALKGVTAAVRNKVMKNMSERAGQSLAEEIELLGPQRVQAVEEAQAEVVRVIRQLEESGQIVVRRGEEDEFVA